MKALKVTADRQWWSLAVAHAEKFSVEFPDRMGIGHGVAYWREGAPSFYVYNTPTMTVVRQGTA